MVLVTLLLVAGCSTSRPPEVVAPDCFSILRVQDIHRPAPVSQPELARACLAEFLNSESIAPTMRALSFLVVHQEYTRPHRERLVAFSLGHPKRAISIYAINALAQSGDIAALEQVATAQVWAPERVHAICMQCDRPKPDLIHCWARNFIMAQCAPPSTDPRCERWRLPAAPAP